MPIFSEHPDYTAHKSVWREYRDVIGGGRKIKDDKIATNYLPMLTGESLDEYKARRGRALFYWATGRTSQGLVGSIFRKDPIFKPELKEGDLREHITPEGDSILEFLYFLITEIINMGRYGTFTDFPGEESYKGYITGYVAESITNWKYERIDGEEKLIFVVLKEDYDDPKNKDRFVKKTRIQYRELFLEEGVFKVNIWRSKGDEDKNVESDWYVNEVFTPLPKGLRIDYIPFDFYNPYDGSADVVIAPIDGVSEVNISHYQSSADLEHGRHFTGLPTPTLSGYPTKDDKDNDITYRIGSTVALVSEDVEAKAGYLEVKGNFKSLESALKEKQALMAILGARLLEETTNTVEASETHRMRRVGENSILASVSKSVSKQFTNCLRRWAKWNRLPNADNYMVQLNTDFNADKLGAQELTSLVLAWQNNAISDETLVYNLKQGEMLPPGRTIEEEILEIQKRLEKMEIQKYKDQVDQEGVERTLGKLTDPNNPNSEGERKLKADRSNYRENINQLSKNA